MIRFLKGLLLILLLIKCSSVKRLLTEMSAYDEHWYRLSNMSEKLTKISSNFDEITNAVDGEISFSQKAKIDGCYKDRDQVEIDLEKQREDRIADNRLWSFQKTKLWFQANNVGFQSLNLKTKMNFYMQFHKVQEPKTVPIPPMGTPSNMTITEPTNLEADVENLNNGAENLPPPPNSTDLAPAKIKVGGRSYVE